MNAKRLMLLSGLITALTAMAAPLTPQQALERMSAAKPQRMASINPANLKLAYTSNTELGSPAAYVFNRENGGYMVLAADDTAFPVLGYSENGVVDPNNMSPEMKWWLESYGRQIQWAIDNNATAALKAPRSRAGQDVIAPLMTTKWDQGAPYYDQCPELSGRHTYTGCVATSMAQVMNYHKYPEVGQGTIAYTPNSQLGRLYLNFAKVPFDWDNMLDYYNSGSYNEAQGEAVAYLMKACGYSVQMGYGLDASGASGMIISDALVKYFKYDGNCRTLRRDVYSASEWEDMVYNNLKTAGPIIFNGQSPLEGGHSFVCDGYDGAGYFHFNWGWSGVSDGYYALGALNPEAQGIGGFAGGFNFMQNGVFGIQPPTGEPILPEDLSIFQYGSCAGTISGNKLTVGAAYGNPCGWSASGSVEHTFNFAVLITPTDGGNTTTVEGQFAGRTSTTFPINGSYYVAGGDRVFTFDLSGINLSNGHYKAVVATRATDVEGAEWTPLTVAWGNSNYVVLNVNGSSITVETIQPKSFTLSDFEVETDLYYNRYALMKVHVANNNDIEVTEGLCPELFNAAGKRVFTGESTLLSLDANQTIDYEWPVRFIALDGAPNVTSPTDFTLRVFNPRTGEYYDDIELKVTMGKNPGNPNIIIDNYFIEGAEKGNMEYGGREFNGVNYVANTSDMLFTFDTTVRSGYVDGEIRVSLSQADVINPSILNPIVDEVATFLPFLTSGTVQTFNVPIQFPEARPQILYYVSIIYNGKIIGRLPFTLGTLGGLNDITIDPNLPVEYYTLQGIRIDKPLKGQIVIVRQGGKTFKTIAK